MMGVERMLEADRNGQRLPIFRWPSGVIPYFVNRNIDPVKLAGLYKAFDYFNDNTCLKFIPRTSEQFYIHVHNGTG
nr:zinc metalloproteinase nas-8-like [Parasteatoda tepidariorum]